MFIAIRPDVDEAIEAVAEFKRLVKLATGRRGKELMAEILEHEHKRAFEHGGWDFKGGDDWMPTSPYWVSHLHGKRGNKPLTWTGAGRESVHAVVNNFGVSIHAAEYLGKFQFGPFEFTETFPIVRDVAGMDWQKVSGLDGDGMKTKRIKIHEREVFAFFTEDVEQWMYELRREAGFGIYA